MVLPPAVVNEPYNQTLSVLQAASPSWTLTGSLPPGLAFNNLQGTISGIPSHTGTFPFAVVATDTSTGEVTQTQSLNIAVRSDPASILRVDCGGTTPSTASATFWPQIDGKSTRCGVAVTLALGSHSVSATLTGFSGPYKIFYGGSCNSTGQVTLTQGNVATCLISAERFQSSTTAAARRENIAANLPRKVAPRAYPPRRNVHEAQAQMFGQYPASCSAAIYRGVRHA